MKGRVKKDRDTKRGKSLSDAAVELIIVQYSLEILNSLLEGVDSDEFREARKELGLSEKKLLN